MEEEKYYKFKEKFLKLISYDTILIINTGSIYFLKEDNYRSFTIGLIELNIRKNLVWVNTDIINKLTATFKFKKYYMDYLILTILKDMFNSKKIKLM